MQAACREIARSVRIGGKALVLVGNRRVGGAELFLDRVVVECLAEHGMEFCGRLIRSIERKINPPAINTAGITGAAPDRRTPTMREEILLVFCRRQ
jgi:hypothetical protein